MSSDTISALDFTSSTQASSRKFTDGTSRDDEVFASTDGSYEDTIDKSKHTVVKEYFERIR